MAFRGPLSYFGVASPTPPNQIIQTRRPTANDYQEFQIGAEWLIPTNNSAGSPPSEELWVLMSKAENIAVWVQVNAGNGATYTDHELLVGTGTATIDSIPHGTSGATLISGGAGSDPAFGDLTVPFGGTSVNSFIAYTPICGGTTTTGALQSVASIGTLGQILTSNGASMLPTFQDPFSGVVPVPNGGTGDSSIAAYQVVCGGVTDVDPLQTVGSLGTLNQVLTSQGAAALPIWADNAATAGFNTINVQIFTTSGTYTPTAGMLFCEVEVLGGGGGGGGGSNSGGTATASAGGGAGGYCKANLTAAAIGASQTITIGAGGAGASGTSTGSTGSATTFGSILTANGGVGSANIGGTANKIGVGGIGGTASGGDINVQGQYGGNAFIFQSSPPSNIPNSGTGANSQYGVGGLGLVTSGNGNNGIGYGSGASGGNNLAATGGTGGSGLVIVTEYIGA